MMKRPEMKGPNTLVDFTFVFLERQEYLIVKELIKLKTYQIDQN